MPNMRRIGTMTEKHEIANSEGREREEAEISLIGQQFPEKRMKVPRIGAKKNERLESSPSLPARGSQSLWKTKLNTSARGSHPGLLVKGNGDRYRINGGHPPETATIERGLGISH